MEFSLDITLHVLFWKKERDVMYAFREHKQ